MPTIHLRFPGGRYHATPWGHHVNEGLIEWPPSPWRLLRALLATGYTRLAWREIPPAGVSLLEKLAGVLPRFRLPLATTGHSRHYMPAPVKTTLVFDTWAHVGDGSLSVTWPVELTTDECDLLARLVEGLGYLGRSESWVVARLDEEESKRPGHDSYVDTDGHSPGPGWEQVALLAPDLPATYARWREEQILKRSNGADVTNSKGKKPTAKAREKEVARVAAPFPDDLMGCLSVDTAWLQRHGWSQPPGSRRILYWRPSTALEVGVQVPPAATKAPVVTCVLLALATPSRRTGALPPVVRAFPQARLLHRSLASLCGKLAVSNQATKALLGTVEGHRVDTDHQHAHLIPLDLDGDERIEHVLVWTPMGLDAQAQRAVRGVRTTYMKGGAGELQVTVVGMGGLTDIARLQEPFGSIRRTIDSSVTWESVTPFLPPRHLKPRGVNALEGQVEAELASRGLRAREIVILDREEHLRRRFRHFVIRDGVTRPPSDVGLALRIVFDRPVQGPICLGFGSHYGLGRFESVDS